MTTRPNPDMLTAFGRVSAWCQYCDKIWPMHWMRWCDARFSCATCSRGRGEFALRQLPHHQSFGELMLQAAWFGLYGLVEDTKTEIMEIAGFNPTQGSNGIHVEDQIYARVRDIC